MLIKKKYEPEVDGLRAVAVLLVVLFHVPLKGIKGGFIGVDIFFVISGYLITRNILFDTARNKFSFREFYARRFRRILPAMYFTMIVSLIIGGFVFSKIDLNNLGGSLLFSCVALQNFYFWMGSGYWDISKDYKPLLHFWSLAVEEQFYLLWPFAIFFIQKKFGEKYLLFIISFVGLLSLIGNEIFLPLDSMAVFYLMPFRIFEFCIGALILWLLPFASRAPNSLKEIILIISLFCIGYCAKFYSEDMDFPGAAALIPCLSAALIILSRSAKISGMILRNKVFVSLGIISYSLYLIHWPIFVFYKYYHLQSFSRIELVAASIMCATLMYFLIEQPFRKKKASKVYISQPVTISILLIFLAIPSAYAWKKSIATNGMSKDLALLAYNTDHAEEERLKFINSCMRDKKAKCQKHNLAKRYLVIGDSYGEDFGMALFKAFPSDEIDLLTKGGCQGLIGDKTNFKKCSDYRDGVFRSNQDWTHYDAVFISNAWNLSMLSLIKPTIDFLQHHGAKHIILVGAKITLKSSTPQIIEKSKTMADYIALSQAQLNADVSKNLNINLEKIANSKKIEFLDLATAECPEKLCPNLIPHTLKPIIWDTGHWTVDGAAYVGRNIKKSKYSQEHL